MLELLQSTKLSSFFTIARFGPDSIVILCLLGFAALAFFAYGLILPAAVISCTFAIIFWAESVEMIHFSRAKPKQIVGSRCLVIKQIAGRTNGGIVRIYKGGSEASGELDPELWSAESDSVIEAETTAIVTGTRSVILLVAAERKLENTN